MITYNYASTGVEMLGARVPAGTQLLSWNSTFHLEFPAGNPATNAGNSSFPWGIKV